VEFSSHAWDAGFPVFDDPLKNDITGMSRRMIKEARHATRVQSWKKSGEATKW